MADTTKIEVSQGARLVKGFREIPLEYHAIQARSVFLEFWAYARREKKGLMVILFSVVLQGAVAGGSIYLLKDALDRFFELKNLVSVLYLVGALFLATVLKSVLEFVANWKRALTVSRMHDELVVEAFRHLLANPFKIHVRERDRKKYRWVLKDSMKFIESCFGIFNAWARQPFVLLSTLVALWVISPALTLVGLALIPLGIPSVLFIKRKTKEFIAERKMLLGLIEEIVSESIRSIRIVKVFGLEENNVARLQQAIDKQRDLKVRNAFYLGLMTPFAEFLGFIGLAVIIFAGSRSYIGSNFTTGTFFVFIMAFLNVYKPLKDVSSGFMNYQFALDAGRRLMVLRIRAAEDQPRGLEKDVRKFHRLKIKNLWFSYEDDPEERQACVLRNVSLEIAAGETVALVGATGSGKSTLCDLICRLYKPWKGELTVNRTQAQDISKESYSRLFALCSQETIVFSNSLFEEIRIACPGADLAQVRSAAEAAGLSGSSGSLSKWIGDRGVRFSGGQRQMIAIARALLRKPQVLILDEAMTGLDIHTADMIWHNIRSILPDTAILAVSHNWDIIRRCQRVLVLANGHIVKSIHVDDIDDTERFFRDFHIAPEK